MRAIASTLSKPYQKGYYEYIYRQQPYPILGEGQYEYCLSLKPVNIFDPQDSYRISLHQIFLRSEFFSCQKTDVQKCYTARSAHTGHIAPFTLELITDFQAYPQTRHAYHFLLSISTL